MQGFDLVTNDHDRIGRVVGEVDDWLIVEQGAVFKSRHPVPKTFTTVLQDSREICVSVPKDMIHDSPKVDDQDGFDRQAAGEHYGLADAFEHPPTEGYGDTDADDPAWGPDVDAQAAGMAPAEQRRAQIRDHVRHEKPPTSPGLLGGRGSDSRR